MTEVIDSTDGSDDSSDNGSDGNELFSINPALTNPPIDNFIRYQ